MKTVIKLALAGAMLAGGAANAANVNTLTDAPTGSSLLLMLHNLTDGDFFFAELTPTFSDLRAPSALQSDPTTYNVAGTNTTGPLNAPAALNGLSVTGLAAYLAGDVAAGDNVQWTIMAGYQGSGGQSVNGQRGIAFTSTLNHLTNGWGGSATLASLQAFQTFIASDLNGTTYVNGASSENGWDGTTASSQNADLTFNGTEYTNGTAVGGSQYLYLVTRTGGNSSDSNIYRSAFTYTLSADGILYYNEISEVPLPAAVWLLGSGLLGLAGVGRRKAKLAVAA